PTVSSRDETTPEDNWTESGSEAGSDCSYESSSSQDLPVVSSYNEIIPEHFGVRSQNVAGPSFLVEPIDSQHRLSNYGCDQQDSARNAFNTSTIDSLDNFGHSQDIVRSIMNLTESSKIKANELINYQSLIRPNPTAIHSSISRTTGDRIEACRTEIEESYNDRPPIGVKAVESSQDILKTIRCMIANHIVGVESLDNAKYSIGPNNANVSRDMLKAIQTIISRHLKEIQSLAGVHPCTESNIHQAHHSISTHAGNTMGNHRMASQVRNTMATYQVEPGQAVGSTSTESCSSSNRMHTHHSNGHGQLTLPPLSPTLGTLGKPQIISEWKNGANYGYSISRPEMQFQDNPGHASASRFNLKPPSILARNFNLRGVGVANSSTVKPPYKYTFVWGKPSKSQLKLESVSMNFRPQKLAPESGSKRNNVRSYKISGESGNVDLAGAEQWKSSLTTMFTGYDLRNVFNMDETGFFF
ncbi:hypothetical protein BASA61_004724, partial [Batrachochytrium salamandrivorans]